MSPLLEVVVLTPRDAELAETGGADRVELCDSTEDPGMSPPPDLVAEVRRVISIELRVMVRLREGFGTDGGEAVRLRGLMASYADAGADGMVLGFLNGLGQVDAAVVGELVTDGNWPWTFHRAVDSCLDADLAWTTLRSLPRLDQVLTAGSARGIEDGLADLVARARRDRWAAEVMMAGGGLRPEHVPWLARAGVRAFHIGSAARLGGDAGESVDESLVHSWRLLVDEEVRHSQAANPWS